MNQKFLTGIETSGNLTVDSQSAVNETVFDVQGTQGQLFSVTNGLSGDLFSVSDISGIPILNINSSGAVDIDGNINIDGTLTINNNVTLQDGDYLRLGTAQDLQIYHNGSHSFIDEVGTGSLYIRTNGSAIYLQDTSNNPMAQFTDGGGSFLMYNGNLKLSTTNTGIDITGEVKGDSLDIDGNADISGTLVSGAHTINSGTDGILTLNQTGTDTGWSYINFNTSGTRNWYVGQDNNKNFDIYNDNTDSLGLSIDYANNSVSVGVLTATTLNTGHGANELYAMNQNVRTTDAVTFNGVTSNGELTINNNASDNNKGIHIKNDTDAYGGGITFWTEYSGTDTNIARVQGGTNGSNGILYLQTANTSKVLTTALSLDFNQKAVFAGDLSASQILFTTLNGHAHIDSQSSSLFLDASNVQLMGNLIPDGNGNRPLGASNRYWSEVYTNGVTSGGNITVNSNSPTLTLGVVNTSTGNAKIQLYSKNNSTSNGYAIEYNKDTGVDRLEFIDGSGNANIKFNNGGSATFAGVLKGPDGSGSAPTYSFSGRTDTGMWAQAHSSNDRIMFNVDGTNRAYIDSNGITTGGNSYASGFRNYSGVWAGTTGTANNGFYFHNTAGGNTTKAMELTHDGNATFTGTGEFEGNVIINTPSSNSDSQGLTINRPAAGTHYASVEFATNGTVDWSVGTNSTDAFEVYENGSASTTRFSIAEGGNATFAGNLTVGSNNITGAQFYVQGTYPRIYLSDTNSNDDYSIINDNGTFIVYNDTDSSTAFSIAGNNNATFASDVTIGGRTTITRDSDALRLNSSSSNGTYLGFQNNTTFKGYIGSAYHLFSSPANNADHLGFRAETQHTFGIQANPVQKITSSGVDVTGTITASGDLTVNGTAQLGNALSDKAIIHGHLGIGHENYPKIAYPGQNALWGEANNSTTGQVVIDLPGTLANFDMLYMEIDIYEYNSTNATKLIIGGHNWNSGANGNTSSTMWHNAGVTVIGNNPKSVYLGWRNDGTNNRRVIAIGETNSTWNYPTIHVAKVHGNDGYSTQMDLVGDWAMNLTTSSSFFTKSPTTNFNTTATTTFKTHGKISASGAAFTNNVDVGGALDVIGHIQAFSRLYLRESIQVVNKAADGWLNFAVRDVSGSEAVYDLSNIGTIAAAGNATFTGNVGVGVSPETKFHVQASDTGGQKTVYGQVLIEQTDAQLDLLSTSSGTWGSAINFVEAGGSNANTDVWSIARKTTSGNGDSSLNFNFGTSNQHDNANKLQLASNGNATFAGTVSASNLSGTNTGDKDVVDDTSPQLGGNLDMNGKYMFETNEATASIDLRDHNNYTWFRNSTNRWIFQGGGSGDDWTQSFHFTLESVGSGFNDKLLLLGQQINNGTSGGKYKGVRIVKSTGSSSVVDGYLQAGDVVITGNLEVQGTTTTVNQTNLDVQDNIIGLNRSVASNANDSGIIIERGDVGNNAALIWDEGDDHFILGTTTADAASTGSITVAGGNLKLGGLLLDGNTITGVDDSEEFTNDDAHIMTSAAIEDKILGYNYAVVNANTTGSSGSCTGNAATATSATTASSAAKLTDGGGISTDPGTSNLIYTGALGSSVTGLFASSDNSNSIITVNRHTGNYNSQLGFSSNGNLYYRKFSNSTAYTTQGWKTLAFTDNANMLNSNVTLATLGAQAAGSYAAASHNHDDRYYTETESKAKFTSTDGTTTGGSDYTFKINDEGNFSGNKWYQVAHIPNTNGGLHIRGFISNHVESFASQKFDLAIACREGGSGANVEITGQLDVLHNATSGFDRAGIRVIKTVDSSYDSYKVYVRTTRYSMVTLRLTQEGSVTFNTDHSSPLTSEPAGLGVELDTSTTYEGNYVVDNSTIKEIFHEGHLPTLAELGAQASGSYLTSDTNYLKSNADDSFSGKLTGTGTSENLKIGGIRGTTKGSQTGEYIHLYNRVHIGGPSGWGHSTHGAPNHGLSTWGSVDFGMNGSGVIQLNGTTIVTAARALTNISDYGLTSSDIPNNAANTSGSSGSCTGNAATASAVAWGNITSKPYIETSAVTSATTTTTVASISGTTYAAVFFDYVIFKSSNIRAGTVVACSDGTSVSFTETSTTDLGDTSDVTLAVDLSSSNFRLRATTTSSTWNIKALTRAI